MRIYNVTSCTFCPYLKYYSGMKQCSASDFRQIFREDDLLLDANGSALETKFPDWCPLEEKPKE